jgi:hypothetical protein
MTHFMRLLLENDLADMMARLTHVRIDGLVISVVG